MTNSQWHLSPDLLASPHRSRKETYTTDNISQGLQYQAAPSSFALDWHTSKCSPSSILKELSAGKLQGEQTLSLEHSGTLGISQEPLLSTTMETASAGLTSMAPVQDAWEDNQHGPLGV